MRNPYEPVSISTWLIVWQFVVLPGAQTVIVMKGVSTS